MPEMYPDYGETRGVVHAHPHEKGHHGGTCDGLCRRGFVTHYHPSERHAQVIVGVRR